MGDVLIRFAAPFDAESIEDVENRADRVLVEHLDPPRWPGAESGATRLSMPGFLLIAEVDETVVGFVHVVEFDEIAHLEQISVLPEHARAGVGRSLLDAAVETAAGRGHTEITLRTFRDVPWNAPFYARCGFEITEPVTDFHHELIDIEHQLGLDLAGPRVQMTRPL